MIRQNLSRKGLLQKILKNSIKTKRKNNWSRQTGAGFIMEDIKDIKMLPDWEPPTHTMKFTFSWGTQLLKASELNLRETEEALKWVEKNL